MRITFTASALSLPPFVSSYRQHKKLLCHHNRLLFACDVCRTREIFYEMHENMIDNNKSSQRWKHWKWNSMLSFASIRFQWRQYGNWFSLIRCGPRAKINVMREKWRNKHDWRTFVNRKKVTGTEANIKLIEMVFICMMVTGDFMAPTMISST